MKKVSKKGQNFSGRDYEDPILAILSTHPSSLLESESQYNVQMMFCKNKKVSKKVLNFSGKIYEKLASLDRDPIVVFNKENKYM